MDLKTLSTQLLLCTLFSVSAVSSQGAASCVGRCGEGYFREHSCHCDYNCMSYMECCQDYKKVCTTEVSCKGRCHEGFIRGQACDCDPSCEAFGRCCADYKATCAVQTESPPRPETRESQPVADERGRTPRATRKPTEESGRNDGPPEAPDQRDEATPRKRQRKPPVPPQNRVNDLVQDPQDPPQPASAKKKIRRNPVRPEERRPNELIDQEEEEDYEDPPQRSSFTKTTQRNPKKPRKKNYKILVDSEEEEEEPEDSHEGAASSTRLVNSPKYKNKRVKSPPNKPKKKRIIVEYDDYSEDDEQDPETSSSNSRSQSKNKKNLPDNPKNNPKKKKRIRESEEEIKESEENVSSSSFSSSSSSSSVKGSKTTKKLSRKNQKKNKPGDDDDNPDDDPNQPDGKKGPKKPKNPGSDDNPDGTPKDPNLKPNGKPKKPKTPKENEPDDTDDPNGKPKDPNKTRPAPPPPADKGSKVRKRKIEEEDEEEENSVQEDSLDDSSSPSSKNTRKRSPGNGSKKPKKKPKITTYTDDTSRYSKSPGKGKKGPKKSVSKTPKRRKIIFISEEDVEDLLNPGKGKNPKNKPLPNVGTKKKKKVNSKDEREETVESEFSSSSQSSSSHRRSKSSSRRLSGKKQNNINEKNKKKIPDEKPLVPPKRKKEKDFPPTPVPTLDEGSGDEGSGTESFLTTLPTTAKATQFTSKPFASTAKPAGPEDVAGTSIPPKTEGSVVPTDKTSTGTSQSMVPSDKHTSTNPTITSALTTIQEDGPKETVKGTDRPPQLSKTFTSKDDYSEMFIIVTHSALQENTTEARAEHSQHTGSSTDQLQTATSMASGNHSVNSPPYPETGKNAPVYIDYPLNDEPQLDDYVGDALIPAKLLSTVAAASHSSATSVYSATIPQTQHTSADHSPPVMSETVTTQVPSVTTPETEGTDKQSSAQSHMTPLPDELNSDISAVTCECVTTENALPTVDGIRSVSLTLSSTTEKQSSDQSPVTSLPEEQNRELTTMVSVSVDTSRVNTLSSLDDISSVSSAGSQTSPDSVTGETNNVPSVTSTAAHSPDQSNPVTETPSVSETVNIPQTQQTPTDHPTPDTVKPDTEPLSGFTTRDTKSTETTEIQSSAQSPVTSLPEEQNVDLSAVVSEALNTGSDNTLFPDGVSSASSIRTTHPDTETGETHTPNALNPDQSAQTSEIPSVRQTVNTPELSQATTDHLTPVTVQTITESLPTTTQKTTEKQSSAQSPVTSLRDEQNKELTTMVSVSVDTIRENTLSSLDDISSISSAGSQTSPDSVKGETNNVPSVTSTAAHSPAQSKPVTETPSVSETVNIPQTQQTPTDHSTPDTVKPDTEPLSGFTTKDTKSTHTAEIQSSAQSPVTSLPNEQNVDLSAVVSEAPDTGSDNTLSPDGVSSASSIATTTRPDRETGETHTPNALMPDQSAQTSEIPSVRQTVNTPEPSQVTTDHLTPVTVQTITESIPTTTQETTEKQSSDQSPVTSSPDEQNRELTTRVSVSVDTSRTNTLSSLDDISSVSSAGSQTTPDSVTEQTNNVPSVTSTAAHSPAQSKPVTETPSVSETVNIPQTQQTPTDHSTPDTVKPDTEPLSGFTTQDTKSTEAAEIQSSAQSPVTSLPDEQNVDLSAVVSEAPDTGSDNTLSPDDVSSASSIGTTTHPDRETGEIHTPSALNPDQSAQTSEIPSVRQTVNTPEPSQDTTDNLTPVTVETITESIPTTTQETTEKQSSDQSPVTSLPDEQNRELTTMVSVSVDTSRTNTLSSLDDISSVSSAGSQTSPDSITGETNNVPSLTSTAAHSPDQSNPVTETPSVSETVNIHQTQQTATGHSTPDTVKPDTEPLSAFTTRDTKSTDTAELQSSAQSPVTSLPDEQNVDLSAMVSEAPDTGSDNTLSPDDFSSASSIGTTKRPDTETGETHTPNMLIPDQSAQTSEIPSVRQTVNTPEPSQATTDHLTPVTVETITESIPTTTQETTEKQSSDQSPVTLLPDEQNVDLSAVVSEAPDTGSDNTLSPDGVSSASSIATTTHPDRETGETHTSNALNPDQSTQTSEIPSMRQTMDTPEPSQATTDHLTPVTVETITESIPTTTQRTTEKQSSDQSPVTSSPDEQNRELTTMVSVSVDTSRTNTLSSLDDISSVSSAGSQTSPDSVTEQTNNVPSVTSTAAHSPAQSKPVTETPSVSETVNIPQTQQTPTDHSTPHTVKPGTEPLSGFTTRDTKSTEAAEIQSSAQSPMTALPEEQNVDLSAMVSEAPDTGSDNTLSPDDVSSASSIGTTASSQRETGETQTPNALNPDQSAHTSEIPSVRQTVNTPEPSQDTTDNLTPVTVETITESIPTTQEAIEKQSSDQSPVTSLPEEQNKELTTMVSVSVDTSRANTLSSLDNISSVSSAGSQTSPDSVTGETNIVPSVTSTAAHSPDQSKPVTEMPSVSQTVNIPQTQQTPTDHSTPDTVKSDTEPLSGFTTRDTKSTQTAEIQSSAQSPVTSLPDEQNVDLSAVVSEALNTGSDNTLSPDDVSSASSIGTTTRPDRETGETHTPNALIPDQSAQTSEVPSVRQTVNTPEPSQVTTDHLTPVTVETITESIPTTTQETTEKQSSDQSPVTSLPDEQNRELTTMVSVSVDTSRTNTLSSLDDISSVSSAGSQTSPDSVTGETNNVPSVTSTAAHSPDQSNPVTETPSVSETVNIPQTQQTPTDHSTPDTVKPDTEPLSGFTTRDTKSTETAELQSSAQSPVTSLPDEQNVDLSAVVSEAPDTSSDNTLSPDDFSSASSIETTASSHRETGKTHTPNTLIPDQSSQPSEILSMRQTMDTPEPSQATTEYLTPVTVETITESIPTTTQETTEKQSSDQSPVTSLPDEQNVDLSAVVSEAPDTGSDNTLSPDGVSSASSIGTTASSQRETGETHTPNALNPDQSAQTSEMPSVRQTVNTPEPSQATTDHPTPDTVKPDTEPLSGLTTRDTKSTETAEIQSSAQSPVTSLPEEQNLDLSAMVSEAPYTGSDNTLSPDGVSSASSIATTTHPDRETGETHTSNALNPDQSTQTSEIPSMRQTMDTPEPSQATTDHLTPDTVETITESIPTTTQETTEIQSSDQSPVTSSPEEQNKELTTMVSVSVDTSRTNTLSSLDDISSVSSAGSQTSPDSVTGETNNVPSLTSTAAHSPDQSNPVTETPSVSETVNVPQTQQTPTDHPTPDTVKPDTEPLSGFTTRDTKSTETAEIQSSAQSPVTSLPDQQNVDLSAVVSEAPYTGSENTLSPDGVSSASSIATTTHPDTETGETHTPNALIPDQSAQTSEIPSVRQTVNTPEPSQATTDHLTPVTVETITNQLSDFSRQETKSTEVTEQQSSDPSSSLANEQNRDSSATVNEYVNTAISFVSPTESQKAPALVTGERNIVMSVISTTGQSPDQSLSIQETQSVGLPVDFSTPRITQTEYSFISTSPTTLYTNTTKQSTRSDSTAPPQVGYTFSNVNKYSSTTMGIPITDSVTIETVAPSVNESLSSTVSSSESYLGVSEIGGTEHPITLATEENVSLLSLFSTQQASAHSTAGGKMENVTSLPISSTISPGQVIKSTTGPHRDRVSEGIIETSSGNMIHTTPMISGTRTSFSSETNGNTTTVTWKTSSHPDLGTSRTGDTRGPMYRNPSVTHSLGTSEQTTKPTTLTAALLNVHSSTLIVSNDDIMPPESSDKSSSPNLDKSFSGEPLPSSITSSAEGAHRSGTDGVSLLSTLVMSMKYDRSSLVTIGKRTDPLSETGFGEHDDAKSVTATTGGEMYPDTLLPERFHEHPLPTDTDLSSASAGSSEKTDPSPEDPVLISENGEEYSVTKALSTGGVSSASEQADTNRFLNVPISTEITKGYPTAMSVSKTLAILLKTVGPKRFPSSSTMIPALNYSSTQTQNLSPMGPERQDRVTNPEPVAALINGSNLERENIIDVTARTLNDLHATSFDFTASTSTSLQEQSTTAAPKSDGHSQTPNSEGLQETTTARSNHIISTESSSGFNNDKHNATTPQMHTGSTKPSDRTDTTPGQNAPTMSAGTVTKTPSPSVGTSESRLSTQVSIGNTSPTTQTKMGTTTMSPTYTTNSDTTLDTQKVATTQKSDTVTLKDDNTSKVSKTESPSPTTKPPGSQQTRTAATDEPQRPTSRQPKEDLPRSTVKPKSDMERQTTPTQQTSGVRSATTKPIYVTPKDNSLKHQPVSTESPSTNVPHNGRSTTKSSMASYSTPTAPSKKDVTTQKPMGYVTARPPPIEEILIRNETSFPFPLDPFHICDLLKVPDKNADISIIDLQRLMQFCTEMKQSVSTPPWDVQPPNPDHQAEVPPRHTITTVIEPSWNRPPGWRIIQILEELKRRANIPQTPMLHGVPGLHTNKSTAWLWLLNKFSNSNDPQMNLCVGPPADGMTTLQNGSMVVFRGNYFWTLNQGGATERPRKISEVWGIPSPIDTVFTRCNCGSKTFFFKGPHYWRFTNDIMDQGYPKEIVNGFGGLRGKITAVLSVSGLKTRPESVFFFKNGVLHEEVSVRSTWRGIPSNIVSAVSLPNPQKQDGFDYYVFSKEKYYNINMSSKVAVKPPADTEQETTKDWYKCRE